MKNPSFDELISDNKTLENIIPRGMWEYVEASGKMTGDRMSEKWEKNFRANLKHIYPKFGSITKPFLGFGKGKATIFVGAGPSFNKNKEDLKKLYNLNIQFKIKDQPFIIVASNHQFKPLLNMGIFPHFVMLGDGGDHVYDQLCTDIPKLGEHAILLATMYADHNIIKDWTKQGRQVCFYIPSSPKYLKIFEEETGENGEIHSVGQGGNVGNACFILALKILHSRVFFALGNDLSFPHNPDVDERRNFFYADKDYSTNVSRVDEAKDKFAWMGYEMHESPLLAGRHVINFKVAGTSRQLFIYKTWIETHAIAWSVSETPFFYYNCTEGGICGVMARSHNLMEMPKSENWYLLDEVIPSHWRTRTLMQASNEFLEANLLCQGEKNLDNATSRGVISLPGKMDTARIINQNRLARNLGF